ncbi:MAG: class I SAM-dependent methyltransferase [Candidatus Omnitrophica bacterium]|nr:class I SAM-dependent methyltransferase [Candidatus Omnitrophota bacterium]
MKKTYWNNLMELKKQMGKVSNTPYTLFAKVLTLVTLNMRYEKIAFNKNVKGHPYELTRQIVLDAQAQFSILMDTAFIEKDDKRILGGKSLRKDVKHQDLFDQIWNRYGKKDYKIYVDRYVHRIKVNKLESLIRGKRCVDMGCGNGNFPIALLKCGSSLSAGVDFGKNSIAYAQKAAKELGVANKTDFRNESVYKTSFKNDSFDFAVQNGVYHHLENEPLALKETCRILKRGGWFWYYTDGEGGISYDLWDTSVEILKNVPVICIENILKLINVRTEKIAHIMDGLSATYAHTSWDKATQKLSRYGFGNFKRLTGGFDTDFDLDRIQSDAYGKEKFGEGDLRILCQLIKK